ncbi:MAG: hypothetical protein ABWW69_06585 [Pyrodictiaceae archaeon]
MSLDEALLIGVAGMLFIAAGWGLAIKDIPPLKLSILYTIGSMLLTIYSIMINDPVFFALNLLATILALINIARALTLTKAFKRRTERRCLKDCDPNVLK